MSNQSGWMIDEDQKMIWGIIFLRRAQDRVVGAGV